MRDGWSGERKTMDNLFEWIKKADNGDAEAQWRVAWYIVWEDQNEPIEPDWLERALEYFELSASQGYGDAMLDLGAMYCDGRGVERSKNKALYWYKKAAEMLHPKAFRCLGYALEIPLGYLDPNDEYADYKTAFGYFLKGAILDEPNSVYKLGDMYFSGKYVDVDRRFAFKLYEESYTYIDSIDDDSYASVCLRLGECYYRGVGTNQDIVVAREYIENAIEGYKYRIERGDPPIFTDSGYNRANYLLNEIKLGHSIAQEVKSDGSDYLEFINSEMLCYPKPQKQIVELEKLKAENPQIYVFNEISYFNDTLASAEQGNNEAMYNIAFYCYNRFESEIDNNDIIDFALYYYHKAIQCGHKGAMYNLGSIYYHGGSAIPVDRYKAYMLYLHSNISFAKGQLGIYYAKGEIVKQDYEQAFKCFAKCALQKVYLSYGSLANLAIMYRKGLFVDVDEKFAECCERLSKKVQEMMKDSIEY